MVQTLRSGLRWADGVTQIPLVSVFGTMVLVLLAAIVGGLAADRSPPLTFVSIEPAAARAGDWVTITSHVQRDMTRDCSMHADRTGTDSSGRVASMGSSDLTDDQRDAIERRTPGVSRITVQVPAGFGPGPAVMTSAMRFRCNVTHDIFPIRATQDLPFEVLQ